MEGFKIKRRSFITELLPSELRNIVNDSKSYSEVLRKLGYNNGHGAKYYTLKKYIEMYDINTIHFRKDKKAGINKRIPLEEITKENSTFSRSNLKKRLLKEGLLENKCSLCGQGGVWQNKPLVMVFRPHKRSQ